MLAYHGGISWLPGGFLGVDAFFVLSGFLITSLLLDEHRRTGAVRLGAFWARRARRLLPALLAVLVFVGFFAAFAEPPGSYPGLGGDELSALFYAANWHFVFAGSSYFAQTGLASPLTHTWSLAIEEQFYLVWPVLVVLLVGRCRRKAPADASALAADAPDDLRRTNRFRPLLVVCIAGAAASAVEMAVLYVHGSSLTRLYYGTDTHAQSLLIGAALAVALARRGRPDPARHGRPDPARRGRPDPARPHDRRRPIALAVLGWAGVAGSALLWGLVSGNSPALYEGGFVLASLGTAAVLLSTVRAPHSLLARGLSLTPLRYLGRISYGVYLWHYPLFIWLDGARTGLTGYPLFGARAALSVAVAMASYHLLERPLRQGTLLRGRRAWAVSPLAVAVTVAVLVTTTLPATTAPAPALASAPSAPGATGRHPVKVLLIGDSTALTLGMALATDAHAYGAVLEDEAILGCGVTDGGEVRSTGEVRNMATACSMDPPPRGTPALLAVETPYGNTVKVPDAEQWTAWYRHWVAAWKPAVVVVLAGRWEVVTRTYRGRWTDILHPAFAAYVRRGLERTVRLASAGGARVVLLTAPCYDAGEQPDGLPWPTDSGARLATYNRIVRSVAAQHPGVVSVVDLDSLVCPGRTYHRVLDGVTVREADGIHFTPSAGPYLGPRIWPRVLQAVRHRQ